MSIKIATNESCDCHLCVRCCKNCPGWFAPGEITKVASFLGISLGELKSTRLIRELRIIDNKEYRVWAPIKNLKRLWFGRRGFLQTEATDDAIKYLEEEAIKEAPRNLPGSNSTLQYMFIRAMCVFLDENERCEIYPVRPHECRKTFGCRKAKDTETLRDEIAILWRERGEGG